IGVEQVQAQTAEQPLGFKVELGKVGYKGDLGTTTAEYASNNFMYGIGLAAYLNRYLGLALDVQYLKLSKRNGPNDPVFKKRNTHFSTSDLNMNLMLRLKPLGAVTTQVSPYIAAGLGVNFLQDQNNLRKNPGNTMFAFPFGLG